MAVAMISYTLSIGTVHTQANMTAKDIRSSIFDKAIEHLAMAKQAYQAGNTTGALDQAHTAIAYLQMIDIPGNCITNNNQMLQCGFPCSTIRDNVSRIQSLIYFFSFFGFL